jgi:hypothetical protein
MKKFYFLALLVVFSVTASAFHVVNGINVTINKTINENVYITGGTITINAPIHGDLIIAGGTIIINDTVSNDILLAGGEVIFNGFVGNDVRCAGGNIRFKKAVNGEVVIAGGTIIIEKNISIGSILAYGGNITVDGNVNGEFRGAVGSLLLNGNILKDLDCRAENIQINGNIQGKTTLAATGNIIIGDIASFADGVRYWVPGENPDFRQSVKKGKAIYDETLNIVMSRWYLLGAASLLGMLWYIGTALLMISIIQYFFSNTMQKAGDTVFEATLKSLGYGILFFIGLPAAAIIAFITIIGVPLGLLLIFNYAVLIILATIITSAVAANWLNNRYKHHWNYRRLIFVSLGVFMILKLLFLIPFFGSLIKLLITGSAFGAILLNLNWKKSKSGNFLKILEAVSIKESK